MRLKRLVLAVPLVSVMAVGCTTYEMRADIDEAVELSTHRTNRYQNDHRKRVSDTNRQAGQNVSRPWIAGKAMPLARDASLPVVLQSRVSTTMLFDEGPTDLIGLADRIQMATGVLVQVKPDAMMPLDDFLPRLSTGGTLLKRPDVADTLIPSISVLLTDGDRMAGPALSASQQRTLQTVHLKEGKAPLSRVLDAISLRLGVYWKFDSNLAAIVFYRTETRAFTVRTQDFDYDADISLGLSGSGGGKSSSGGGQFQSTSNTSFKLDGQNPSEEVVRKISQFMSRAGKVEKSGGGNTIIVTDTKDALEAIEAFLEKENKAMTRRVRLLFEEVTIQHDSMGQMGIDWGAIYASAGRMTMGGIGGVAAMLDESKGLGGLGGEIGSGQWSGSSVSAQALSEIGKVLRKTSMPMLSLNRRPATYAVRESFRFIDEMEQTQSTSDSSNPTVTAKQVEETVGTFLTVIPDAQDDGQVLLTMNYNDSRLVSLNKEQLGENAFLQQPRISAQGMTQQVELRSGQSTLVAGFEQEHEDYTNRRLDKNAPMILGGSDKAQQKNILTLLFVTVIPEEGY